MKTITVQRRADHRDAEGAGERGWRRLTCAASTVFSSATFYKWKAKFGGLDVSDARRLKALEDENAKLKKLLAEQMLDNAMLRGRGFAKVVTPAARRDAAAHLVHSVHQVSQRRACSVLGVDRSSVRYRGVRPDDADLAPRR
jgi:putative transposase